MFPFLETELSIITSHSSTVIAIAGLWIDVIQNAAHIKCKCVSRPFPSVEMEKVWEQDSRPGFSELLATVQTYPDTTSKLDSCRDSLIPFHQL